ncbi:putative bifunctional diguanylate cyclase/phosphodiesterase [Liberibacter crescens]|uniref:putative bifunctional diguanylate cyclase/phosphodiesterase n=1 Tax=Liberibacter crescens TaxID=1273132 RepID=UPI00155E9ECA|nr:EAL domain-containing protein [Liberibacter crescens]
MIDLSQPELLRAQYEETVEKGIVCYFILVFISCLQAYRYFILAPFWITVLFPILLYIPVSLTLLYWWLYSTKDFLKVSELTNKLRVFCLIFCFLAIVLSFWFALLAIYGNTETKFILFFSYIISVISTLICILNLRQLIVILAILIQPIFLWILYTQSSGAALFLGIESFIILILVLYTAIQSSENFIALVNSRNELAQQRNDFIRLSENHFRMANIDILTGLPNRRCFFEDLKMLSEKNSGKDLDFSIGIVDLDNFKSINNLYGHIAGDHVLCCAAKRLEETVGKCSAIYRLGGDEFGIIISRKMNQEALLEIATRVINTIKVPFSFGSIPLVLGCSIGYASYPKVTNNIDLLYKYADYALYYSKHHGRSRAIVFNSDHEKKIKEQGFVQKVLCQANLEKEFYIVYQPIIEKQSNKVVAFECLMRLRSPVIDEVSPEIFIVLAEQSGLITSITPVLLRKALQDVIKWSSNIRINFNLSAYDICTPGQIDKILSVFPETGIDPSRIDFELTETAITYNLELACQNLKRLRDVGANIVLDDFGTGYSSLSHLHGLPLKKIKISRIFVQDIEGDGNSYKIVKFLSLLCKDMGLDCIAEGVENINQVQILSEIGYNLFQGHYFAKPMLGSGVLSYLDKRTFII